jgi:hypothetical protein
MADKVQEATESMVRNLEAKTGRCLSEWVATARASGRARHGEIVAFLKAEHGLGHGYANLVAQQALQPVGQAAPEGDDLVSAQYGGAKVALRPVYDALVGEVVKFGGDVEISPKKTYVSLRRSKQFGLIQPSSSDRIDVGINLKGVEASGRLEPSGSFNSMVSHRVRVRTRDDVNDELVGWLRRAYEAS